MHTVYVYGAKRTEKPLPFGLDNKPHPQVRPLSFKSLLECLKLDKAPGGSKELLGYIRH